MVRDSRYGRRPQVVPQPRPKQQGARIHAKMTAHFFAYGMPVLIGESHFFAHTALQETVRMRCRGYDDSILNHVCGVKGGGYGLGRINYSPSNSVTAAMRKLFCRYPRA